MPAAAAFDSFDAAAASFLVAFLAGLAGSSSGLGCAAFIFWY